MGDYSFQPDYLTLADAAEALGTKPEYLIQMACQGKLQLHFLLRKYDSLVVRTFGLDPDVYLADPGTGAGKDDFPHEWFPLKPQDGPEPVPRPLKVAVVSGFYRWAAAFDMLGGNSATVYEFPLSVSELESLLGVDAGRLKSPAENLWVQAPRHWYDLVYDLTDIDRASGLYGEAVICNLKPSDLYFARKELETLDKGDTQSVGIKAERPPGPREVTAREEPSVMEILRALLISTYGAGVIADLQKERSTRTAEVMEDLQRAGLTLKDPKTMRKYLKNLPQ